jgi:beta-galactosidase GanA
MNDPRIHDEKIHTGVSWYPEMWPESEWPADIAKMQEIGITMVRLFEFAWKRMEPSEGVFDLSWTRRVLDLLHAAGIKAMVGTPTAAPPSWLTTTYPEVLGVSVDGKRKTHGQRAHANHNSLVYRSHCIRITEAMARELGSHPAVHSWQIDNEMNGYDYGEHSQGLFHRWLKKRYGTIENLNTTWGLEIWSQAYDSFEEIPLAQIAVGGAEVPERHHPSLLIAIARFQNDFWNSYIADQCACIRKYTSLPITTNMTGGMGPMHWFRHNQVLDRVGYSMYSDLLHYNFLIWKFDRMRAEKNAPYWLLETAPNWSGGGQVWNIHHDANGIQTITWLNIALGGSMTLYWQWREHWAGQEMQHGTLVTATGKWRPNRDSIAAMTKDFARTESWLLSNPPVQAKVGLLLDPEAAWAWSIDPLENKFSYESRWRDTVHLPLAGAHIWRDVIWSEADFSPYKALILPWQPMLKDSIRVRLKDFVASGGLLILGPMTGYRTEEFTAYLKQEFGGLEELIGATCTDRFPPLWMEDRLEVQFTNGTIARTRQWCDGFTPTGAEVLARYHYTTPGGYGEGSAAVLAHNFGKGRVITLGCPLEPHAWLPLVQKELAAVGITPIAQSSGKVVVVPRGKNGALAGWCVVNITEEQQEIRLPSAGTDLITGRKTETVLTLKPLEKLVITI